MNFENYFQNYMFIYVFAKSIKYIYSLFFLNHHILIFHCLEKRARIIAIFLKIIRKKGFFLNVERKSFKYKLEKGHFGEKGHFLQTLNMFRWILKS